MNTALDNLSSISVNTNGHQIWALSNDETEDRIFKIDPNNTNQIIVNNDLFKVKIRAKLYAQSSGSGNQENARILLGT